MKVGLTLESHATAERNTANTTALLRELCIKLLRMSSFGGPTGVLRSRAMTPRSSASLDFSRFAFLAIHSEVESSVPIGCVLHPLGN
jgi:hypothetical protein